jgi:hypothetical protein
MTRAPYYPLSRREWLRLSTAGVIGYSMSGWLEVLAAEVAGHAQRRRACILLWMSGGPSQMDTFDLKPGHANGGPYKEIATSVPGIRISEHLPKIAKHMDRLAIVRSMSTKEADHGRATFLMRTGHAPGTPIQYPPLGSLLAKELGDPEAVLPSFVSIAPARGVSPESFGSGFLGPQYVPLVVGDGGVPPGRQRDNSYERALRVENMELPGHINRARGDARIDVLGDLEKDFLASRPAAAALSHRTAYERAVKMMRSAAGKAFDLADEPATLRDAYGRNLFGQGCLLARRLVERGVPFVEVTLGNTPDVAVGWDTHLQNFDNVRKLSGVLDAAWATLMGDLKQRGMLDTTTLVWMGEFGRTPDINDNQGRDHWATSWSTVLGGGGIRGGQVIGRTSPDGKTVTDRPVAVADFLATICLGLGIDAERQNTSNVGRPIRVVEKTALPIKELLA